MSPLLRCHYPGQVFLTSASLLIRSAYRILAHASLFAAFHGSDLHFFFIGVPRSAKHSMLLMYVGVELLLLEAC